MKKQLGILIVLTLLVVFVLFLVFSLPKYFSAKTDLFTAIDNRDYTAISKIITQYPSLVNSIPSDITHTLLSTYKSCRNIIV